MTELTDETFRFMQCEMNETLHKCTEQICEAIKSLDKKALQPNAPLPQRKYDVANPFTSLALVAVIEWQALGVEDGVLSPLNEGFIRAMNSLEEFATTNGFLLRNPLDPEDIDESIAREFPEL